MEANSANLSRKRNLKEVYLSWNKRSKNESQESVEHVLEALEPSPNLSRLSIYNYKGISFPHWMSDVILGNVTKITLSGCKKCVELPPLGTLALLQDLEISGMDIVQYIDNQSYDGQLKRCFMQLRRVHLKNMPNLEGLSKEEGREMLPCLSELRVTKCPKLKFPSTGSVKHLELFKLTELSLRSIKNLCGLTRLVLDINDGVTLFPEEVLENLSTLRSLTISKFTALQELSTDMLIASPNLARLEVDLCPKLKCFPEGLFRTSACLNHIAIKSCTKLKSLSDSFGELTALESMELVNFPGLEVFPNSLNRLSSLRKLTISGRDMEWKDFIFILGSPIKLADLPEAFQHLPSLESMTIECFKELVSLPHWLGNLQSLRELRFFECTDLARLPTSFKRLTNLENLTIGNCPKLEERCQREVGEDWDKIAHIPHVYLS